MDWIFKATYMVQAEQFSCKSVGGTQQESCDISEDLFLFKFFYKKALLRDLQELKILSW